MKTTVFVAVGLAVFLAGVLVSQPRSAVVGEHRGGRGPLLAPPPPADQPRAAQPRGAGSPREQALPAHPPSGLVPPLPIGTAAAELPRAAAAQSRARSEPHGHHICAAGCAVSHHPTPRLSAAQCRRLLAQYQQQPYDQESDALDQLLSYGGQAAAHLRDAALAGLLDEQHRRFLQRELGRSRVFVSLRIVDEHGRTRADLPSTGVPQHVRQVFDMDVVDWQPLVCSGTVKRVGLHHLWQRL